jgi:hypothetical protein
MLGPVKKILPPIASGDLAGRLGAWWDGRAYVPASSVGSDTGSDTDAPPAGAPEGETASAPKAAKAETPPKAAKASKAPKPPKAPKIKKDRKGKATPVSQDGGSAGAGEPSGGPATPAARLRALAAMWGEGRFGPASAMLDSYLLDAIEGAPDKGGAVGFIGADPALIAECANRFHRPIRASEWRPGCVGLISGAVADVEAAAGDIDRPKVFPEGAMGVILSVDAFAYSDHKAGLVSRVYRALSDTGRWVMLDITRTTARTPPEAFASAWAEPQIAPAEDIEELLSHAGFQSVRRAVVTDMMLQTVKAAFAQVPARLEQAAAAMREGREGAKFLQEFTWELTAWRARKKALEGGALAIDLWIAEKTASVEAARGPAVIPEVGPDGEGLADAIMAAIDQGSIDSLFD